MKALSKLKIGFIILVASLVLFLLAFFYYKSESGQIIKEKHEFLEAVTNIKLEQIVKWRTERIDEAEFFPTIGRIVKYTAALNENKNNQEAKNYFSNTFLQFNNNGYDKNIIITNIKGEILFTLDSSFNNIDQLRIEEIEYAVKQDSVIIGDFYFCKSLSSLILNIVSVIKDNSGNPIGVFVQQVDPYQSLYPIIQSWPVSSKSAETLLFKKEDDHVVYLNDLRHKKNSALSLKIHITKSEITAVKAVLGARGIIEGKDYRGKDVLAAVKTVPGTDWFMVSKVDKEEIYSELFYRAGVISLIALISILLISFAAFYVYKFQQSNTYKNLFLKEKELAETQEEYRTALYSIGDAVITTDIQGRIKQMNSVAEALSGWKENEVRGKSLSVVFNVINEETNEPVENPVTRVLRAGAIVGLANHTLLINKDGRNIPIADSGSPIKNDKGEIIGVVLVFRDQTEEREKERATLESEEKFRRMTLNSPTGMHFYELTKNDDLVLIDSNPAADKILGIDHTKLRGKTIEQAFPSLANTEVPQKYREAASKGILWATEQITYKDEMIEGAFEVKAYQTKPNNMVAVFADITERKKYEESLKSSEEKYRMLLDFASDAFFQGDSSGNFIYVNNKAIDLTGYSREELLKMNMKDLFSNELLETRPLRYDKLLAGETIKTERKVVKRDGKHIYVEMTSKQMPDGTYQSFMRDITEIKKSEKELADSQERFSKAFTTSPDSININRLSDGIYVSINNGFTKMTGYTESEVIGKTSAQIQIWADIKYRNELVEKLKTTSVVDNFEAKFRMKDGIIKDGLMSAAVIELNGEPHIISVTRDISERKKAEEIIKSSEANLNSLINNRNESIWSIDRDYNYIVFNNYFAEAYLVTYNQKLVKGINALNILTPELKAFWKPKYDLALSGKKTEFEFTYLLNNSHIYLQVFLNPIISDGIVTGVSALSVDITERKKSELDLQKGEELKNSIVNSLLAHVAVIDSDGMIISVNEPWRKFAQKNGISCLLGTVEKVNYLDVIRKSIADGAENLTEILKGIEEVLNGVRNKYAIEYTCDSPDELRWFSMHVTPLFFGGGAVISHENITDRVHAEARLRTLSQAIEQSPVIIVITDLKGDIDYVNPKFTEVTGYRFDEVKGQNINILKSDMQDKGIFKSLWETIMLGNTWRGEINNKKKNGKLYWEETVISPILDSNGNIINFISVGEDITERKKLLTEIISSEEKFRSIWENSVDAMRLVDEEGMIINVNESYCNLFGLPKEKLIGNSLNVSYIVAESDTSLDGFKERFKNGAILKKFETEINLLSGKVIWIELTNSFIEFEDKPAMLLSIIRDISDRKAMISELTVAKEKAEEMVKLKSYFFANMSHELRTPFVGILGFAEILKDTLQNSDEREYAEQILKSSKRLTDTLNKILNVTRLEFDKVDLNYKEFDVCLLIKSVEGFYYNSAKLNNTKISSVLQAESIIVKSDAKLLEDVLNNLVNNAVKFTQNGIIKLIAEKIIEDKKGYLVIKVEDNGIGIPEEKQSLVWQEFRQASEGMNRSFEGTGLGLTISKKYVELLGGEISIESKENVGTVFTIKLPLNSHEIKVSGPNDKTIVPIKVNVEKSKNIKHKILYVEDDMVALQFINIILKSTYEVETVYKASAAIELTKRVKYDAIMLDINLGSGMDGVELMQKIREIEYYKNIPIVAVTAYAAQSDKTEFLAKGFTHYISKPFTKNELLSLLKNVFST